MKARPIARSPGWKSLRDQRSPRLRSTCWRPRATSSGRPANLGYISGALKHFFDQIYYPCLDATIGRPFAVYLHGNNDTVGASKAIDVITTGLRWRRAQAPVEVVGTPSADDLAACRELGAALAAGLMLET